MLQLPGANHWSETQRLLGQRHGHPVKCLSPHQVDGLCFEANE